MTAPNQADLDAIFAAQAGGASGVPSYGFDKVVERNKIVPVIGQVVQGEVVDLFPTVVKDIDTGEPKLDKNGKKQDQINITIRTADRNWAHTINPGKGEDGEELPPEADEGLRRIYAKHRLLQAIAKAVAKATGTAGAPKPGGKLAIKVKSLEWDEKNPTRNPLPDYEAFYEPPNPADAAFAQAAQQTQQATPAQQAPPQTPAAAPAPPVAAAAPQAAPPVQGDPFSQAANTPASSWGQEPPF